MKKITSILMAAILVLGLAAFAEDNSALDAFNALTGKQVQIGNPDKTNAEYLSDIMAGLYEETPADTDAAALMASDLQYLVLITNRDIASFASDNRYDVRQVRNAYYIALASCLRAEIMVNPAAEERYRNVQLILALFLESDEALIDYASRESIRNSMTTTAAAAIAAEYGLPTGFVEFVIMDDDWNDDLWENDDDWREEIGWDDDDIYDDSEDELQMGDRDDAQTGYIADMQERLIALGYLTGKADGIFGAATQAALIQYQLANGETPDGVFDIDDLDDMYDDDVVARWDYSDSFDYDDTDDYTDSPESQDSVDYDDTPEAQDSADYDDTPAAQDSVDYDDTPAVQDSVDYDDSPDVTAAPVVQDSVDYDENPAVQDSADYDDTPEAQDSADYDDTPEAQDSVDYDDTPEAQDSVDYDDTPEAQDSVDYEDSADD